MGFRSLINYLVSVPHSQFAKLLSIFNGEKMNIDSSLWLDKLKKETYQENTAEEPSKFIQHELCGLGMFYPNRLRRFAKPKEIFRNFCV